MAQDLSNVANGINGALSLSNLILVSPQKTVGYQPQNEPTIYNNTEPQQPALLFNYEGEQSVTLTSDITDHFIEDNSAIQDQISLKPELITTHGFIGELNDVAPAGLLALQTTANKLVAIGAYEPQISETAALAYAAAFAAYQLASSLATSAVSAWSTVNGGVNGQQTVINGSTTQSDINNQTNSVQNKQQIYFSQFYGYWKNRTLFTVQTPWAVFQDMAIQSLRAIQNAETNVITDFEITFKLMRFASTQVTLAPKLDSSNYQGRGLYQSGGVQDNGTSTLQESSLSFSEQVA